MDISEADFTPMVIPTMFTKPRHMISERFNMKQNIYQNQGN